MAPAKDQKGGRIVNIASINGLRGKFGQANYAASKGGEIALSKSLARELGKFNVNVNVVAPGMVMTDDGARRCPPEFLETGARRDRARAVRRARGLRGRGRVPVLGSRAPRHRAR